MPDDEGWLTHLSSGVLSHFQITSANPLHHKGKAIELNKPHQMMVVVDVDAKAEIELYTAAGFNRMEGQNSITASYQAKSI